MVFKRDFTSSRCYDREYSQDPIFLDFIILLVVDAMIGQGLKPSILVFKHLCSIADNLALLSRLKPSILVFKLNFDK